MKNTFCSALFTFFLLILSTPHALEMTAQQKVLEGSSSATTKANFEQTNDLLKKFLFCQAQLKFYIPGHPDADANGCVEKICFSPITETFNYSGSEKTTTVPDGAKTLTVEMWGAAGGEAGFGSPPIGGAGGFTKAVFEIGVDKPIQAGQTLYIVVGGGGGATWHGRFARGGYGGGGNGGGGNNSPGGGGGMSALLTASLSGSSQSDALAVAGGGCGGLSGGSTSVSKCVGNGPNAGGGGWYQASGNGGGGYSSGTSRSGAKGFVHPDATEQELKYGSHFYTPPETANQHYSGIIAKPQYPGPNLRGGDGRVILTWE